MAERKRGLLQVWDRGCVVAAMHRCSDRADTHIDSDPGKDLDRLLTSILSYQNRSRVAGSGWG